MSSVPNVELNLISIQTEGESERGEQFLFPLGINLSTEHISHEGVATLLSIPGVQPVPPLPAVSPE